jgi:DNA-binding response OmpR family regulator
LVDAWPRASSTKFLASRLYGVVECGGAGTVRVSMNDLKTRLYNSPFTVENVHGDGYRLVRQLNAIGA